MVGIIHRHSRRTGVSTFSESLRDELVRRGIEAEINASNPSIELHNYRSTNDGTGVPKYHFVHGLMTEDYMPDPEMVSGCFVFGERARDYIKKHTGMDSILIRNGVDLSKFKPEGLSSAELKRVFVFDVRHGFALEMFVRQALERAGINAEVTSLSEPVEDVRGYINEADLVIGIGRSMFEAMACGRPCINMGIRGGDGYVTPDNFQSMLITNGSGWTERSIPSIFEPTSMDVFASELNRYNFADGRKMRKLAVDHLGIREQVDIILKNIQYGYKSI